MQAVLALFLVLFPGPVWTSALLVERENGTSTICKQAPDWEVNGHAPMKGLMGSVVVVALLKAS